MTGVGNGSCSMLLGIECEPFATPGHKVLSRCSISDIIFVLGVVTLHILGEEESFLKQGLILV